MNRGALVELVFQMKESGGTVELVDLMDDREEFILLNSRANSPPMRKNIKNNHRKE